MAKNRSSMAQRSFSRRRFVGTGPKLGVAMAGLPGYGAARAYAQTATTITMMGWGSPLEKANVDKGLQTFESDHPDIDVEWIHVPDDYSTKLTTTLAGGTPPDVFWQTQPRDYIARGVVMDITSFLEADSVLSQPDYFIQPQERNRSTVDGKWYGIGSCWVLPHLYYNTSLLEEAGVDPPSSDPAEAWTWDEFLEVARRLTVDGSGKHPDQAGFNPDDIQQWGVFWPTDYIQRDALVYSNGGVPYTEDHRCHYGEPEAVEAIQTLADLTLKHHVAPQAATATQLGMSAWQMLASGKVAILADGSWALQDISQMGFTFGCGVLPKLKEPATTALAHLHVIHKDTEYPEASWELLAYLSSDDYQRGLCQVGLWLPSHTTLLTEEGLASWITPGVHPEGYEQIATEYLLNHAEAYYYPAGFEEANRIITAALDPVWIGGMNVEEAFETSAAIAEVNAVLEENLERLEANT